MTVPGAARFRKITLVILIIVWSAETYTKSLNTRKVEGVKEQFVVRTTIADDPERVTARLVAGLVRLYWYNAISDFTLRYYVRCDCLSLF